MNEAEIRRGFVALLLLEIFAKGTDTPKVIRVKATGEAFVTLCMKAVPHNLLTEKRIPRGYRSERPLELTYAFTGGWFRKPKDDVAEFWPENFEPQATRRVSHLREIVGERWVLIEALVRDAYQTYLTLLSEGVSV